MVYYPSLVTSTETKYNFKNIIYKVGMTSVTLILVVACHVSKKKDKKFFPLDHLISHKYNAVTF